MQRIVLATLVALVVAVGAPSALAIPQFQKAFEQKYIETHENAEFKKFVHDEAKCFVCHQGKSKKNHNVYGEQVEELLTKKDKDDTAKIMAALEEVGAMHIDPENEESPTYADVIAEGKLPGGELEELKKEPEGEE